nr:Eco29kI family restriction endonuclease [Polaromonas sp.]
MFLLIANFAPIWNTLIDGFGNYDPGNGRYRRMCLK